MIRILADQNFNGKILRGLKSRLTELDCVTTYELGIQKFTDYDLLTFAAEENRIILTHDSKTFPGFSYEKIAKDEKMSGVIVVSNQCSIGQAIDEIEIALLCNSASEWENNVTRIPL